MKVNPGAKMGDAIPPHEHLRWKRLWEEEEAQTLVEFALIVCLIALVVVAMLTFMARNQSNTFVPVNGSAT